MSKGHPIKLGYEGDSHLPPERFLRLYQVLPSAEGDIEVWFVDGEEIRDHDWVDFTQASNPWAFPEYVPPRKVILDIANEKEADRNLVHELYEGNCIRLDGEEYEEAHEKANTAEIEAREHPERLPGILQKEIQRLQKAPPSRFRGASKNFKERY